MRKPYLVALILLLLSSIATAQTSTPPNLEEMSCSGVDAALKDIWRQLLVETGTGCEPAKDYGVFYWPWEVGDAIGGPIGHAFCVALYRPARTIEAIKKKPTQKAKELLREFKMLADARQKMGCTGPFELPVTRQWQEQSDLVVKDEPPESYAMPGDQR